MLSWRRQWTPDAYWLPRRVSFHRYLGLEAFEVTEDRGDGKHAPIALEPQDTVLRGNIPLSRELIPLIGMADIVDRDVVVLAPEEGHGGKSLAVPEHVERSGVTLALCHYPMLDANALAAMQIRPARNVAAVQSRDR